MLAFLSKPGRIQLIFLLALAIVAVSFVVVFLVFGPGGTTEGGGYAQ
jgi:hypothetical protein